MRWALTGAAVLLLAAALVRARPDTAPDSDIALIDLSTLGVLHGTQPVGAYSRYEWHHPGPLYFQLLAPLYALSGHRHLAIDAGAAAINVAALLLLLVVFRRCSTTPVTLTAAALFAVYLARLDGLLDSPWNPHVPVLPLALLLGAAAAAASGAFGWLPVAVGLASFVVQTHVGFTPAAAAALGTAVVLIATEALITRRRTRALPRGLTRAVVASAVVAAAVWAVPLIDEVRAGGYHNLHDLVAFFTSRAPFNPREAAHAFEHLFVAPFTPSLALTWGDAARPARDLGVRALVDAEGVLLLVAIIVWGWRRRRFERNLSIVSFVCGVAALVAVRDLPEAVKGYTVLWVTVLGVMAWAPILSLPVDLLASRIAKRAAVGRAVKRWSTVAIVAAVLIATGLTLRERRRQDVSVSSRIARITALVRDRVAESGSTSPLIHVPQDFWGVATGVVLQLARAGLHPAVDADWVSMFGRAYAPAGDERPVVQFAQFLEHGENFRHRTNYRFLGRIEDIYTYSVEPPPAHSVLDAPLTIVDSQVQRSEITNRKSQITNALRFSSDTDYVTFRVPDVPVVGLRLEGDGGSEWQIRCAGSTGGFDRIGRVTIDPGDGTQPGEAFLREIGECRELKIAPAQPVATRLVDVRLLVRTEGPRVPGA